MKNIPIRYKDVPHFMSELTMGMLLQPAAPLMSFSNFQSAPSKVFDP